jgi:acyl-CoA synthetase (AMP-forming)/AMP-acid ligase II
MLPADMAAIEEGIREFSKFDPTSEAFRYPADKQGAPSIASAATSLSIRGLAQAMDELAARLRNLDGLLGADVDLEREFRHDVYPEP